MGQVQKDAQNMVILYYIRYMDEFEFVGSF